jgi:hypothetical protein
MRMFVKTALALGVLGAAGLSVSSAPAQADGFYINVPGVHIGVGGPRHRYYDSYQGPAAGAGWNTWNGCPPGYTVQGGACAPYRGD